MWTLINPVYGQEIELDSWDEFVSFCRRQGLEVPIRCQRLDRAIETLGPDNVWQRTLVPTERLLAERIGEARMQLHELARKFDELAVRAHYAGQRDTADELGKAASALGSIVQATEKLHGAG
jgi:hypothetical protein